MNLEPTQNNSRKQIINIVIPHTKVKPINDKDNMTGKIILSK